MEWLDAIDDEPVTAPVQHAAAFRVSQGLHKMQRITPRLLGDERGRFAITLDEIASPAENMIEVEPNVVITELESLVCAERDRLASGQLLDPMEKFLRWII